MANPTGTFETFLRTTAAEREWKIKRVEYKVSVEVDPRDPSVKRIWGGMEVYFYNDCIAEVARYMESFLRKEGQDLGIYQRGVLPLDQPGNRLVLVTFFFV